MKLWPQGKIGKIVLTAAATAIGGSLLACWLLPHFVNKKALKNRLRQWAEKTLDYTSPAELGDIDVALRLHGRTDLYIHDLAWEAPNPAFAFPWLKVSAVRASAPFYELWGGLRANTAIQVRRPLLRLQWDKDGHCNLDGLRLRKKIKMPLSGIDAGNFRWTVSDGTVLLSHPLLVARARVGGTFAVDTIGHDQMRAENIDVALSFRSSENAAPRQGRLRLRRGEWKYENRPESPTLEAEIDDWPLRLLNVIFPKLPTFPESAVISGSFTEHNRESEFSGEVSGRDFQVLPARTAFTLRCQRDGKKRDFHLQLQVPEKISTLPKTNGEGSGTLAVLDWKNENGKNLALRGSFPLLDLHGDPRGFSPAWAEWLASSFPKAHFTAGEMRLGEMRFFNVQLDAVIRPGGLADISAECLVAGGKMLLTAGGLPLAGGAPKSFNTALDVPALGDTLLYFSGMLPPLFHISPLRGKGQAALSYARADDGTPRFDLQMALEDVTIPVLTAGATLQTLNNLKDGMTELENLTRRADITPRPPLPETLPANDGTLEFTSILARYELGAGGKCRLKGLEAVSPQIGKLQALGQSAPGGSFRLEITLSDVPESVFAPLSPAVRQAAREVIGQQGLRINCVSTPDGGTVEKLYIQDIFRKWVENNSRR